MKFCPECGVRLVSQKFCHECGFNIASFIGGASVSQGNDPFDFSVLQSAQDKLIAESGLVIENGVLTAYNGKRTRVLIPGCAEEIYQNVFYNNSFISDVEMEYGVRVIGANAFRNCRCLKSVKIPSSVSRIGEYSFYDTSLDALILDEYNESVRDNVLKHCVSSDAISYLNTGANISYAVKQENGNTVISIKAIESKANEYKAECIRQAEQERKRKLEEMMRRAEEARLAEEKRLAEEEAKRLAEEAEMRRRAEEAAAKQRAEEEERQRREKEAQRNAIIASWEVSGRPTFGSYRFSEIQWIVLAREGSRALIVSYYALERKNFHKYSYEDYSWANSDIRKWLNDDFLKGFAPSDKEKILSVNGDKVFLLTRDEAKRYFRTDSERKCSERYKSTSVAWWLRTPGDGAAYSHGTGSGVIIVLEDGSIFNYGVSPSDTYDSGFRRTVYSNHGVRPAMWVDVNKIISEL